LTAEQVTFARAMRRAGWTLEAIAIHVGLSEWSVRQMLTGVTYADVPGWLTVKQRKSLGMTRGTHGHPIP
jgi:uncharacterized protein YcnI